MEAIISLIAMLGMGYGVFRGLKWMMRAGNIQTGKITPLSPNDLKVLEESAARLMADLRAVTDECVARIEQACADAQGKVERIESSHIPMAHPSSLHISPTQTASTWPVSPVSSGMSALDANESSVSIARESGMTTGEVDLLRGLQAMKV